MIHAHQMGPAKDLSRVRIGRHGSLRVEGKTLLFVSDDGRQVSITLEMSDDMCTLAEALSKSAKDVALTEVTQSMMLDEEFTAPKVFPR